MSTFPDWQEIRAQFPAVRRWTYLNTATFGQLPERAVRAVSDHFARRNAQACQDFLSWFGDVERIRALLARMISCSPADIAFIPNASTALSLLLGGLPWKAGDRILTLENEFPNQYYFPASLAARGVELVEAPFERFYESVTPNTRVVALSTVNYATGFRAPVEEIAAYLRQRGVLFYVDGTQSLGALRFDVSTVLPDLFAVNAYKWMCSPNGAAFMYVSPVLRARLAPAVIGWRSDRNWRSVDSLNHGAPEFVESAEKYEGGMLAFSALYGLEQSAELMLEIGLENIEARVLGLAAKARAVLEEAGAALPHADTSILSAKFAHRSVESIAARLQSRRIVAAARHGHLRISPHFYNDESDVEKLQEALSD